MNSVRILHTADWHLGKENTYLGALANGRKYEITVTAKRIISLCEEADVDLLLIAGDIFDNNRIESEIIDEIFEALGQLTHTKVVIALGNHDPLTADSPFKNRTLSPNIYVLPENDYVLNFDDLNCRVYGSSFASVYRKGNDRFFITPADDNKINLMVLHGETRADLSSDYRSITKDFIESSKMDYIALGHNHKRSEVMKLGTSNFAYSGCIEGQGFDEDGQKGVYIGNITKAGYDLEFVSLAKRTHYCLNLNITDSASICDDVIKAIKEASSKPAEDLFKITLTGEIDPATTVNCDDIYAKVSSEVYFLKLKDRTGIKVDLDALASENSLRGRFVKEMLNRIENADEDKKAVFQNALQIGLKSFERQVSYGED